jgi:hypothetical protein
VYEVTTTSAPAAASARPEPRRARVSVTAATFRSGVKRAASAAQLATTLVGASTRNGPAAGSCSRAWQTSASAWSVLPSPMSSARIPPRRCRKRAASQLKPASWYGRSAARNPSGAGSSARSAAEVSDRTDSCHAAAWPSTTPIRSRSAHRLAWNRLSRTIPSGASCSARASSISVASCRSSSRSRLKYVPLGRTSHSSPCARATNRLLNGTSSPSTSTETDRSNQSPAAASPAGSPLAKCTTGAAVASR